MAGRFAGGALIAALLLAVGPAVPGGGTTHASAAGSCDNAPLPNAPTVRVLVVGDSLSHGSAGDHTWRYRFWKAQRAQGVNVDFVGPYRSLMPTWDSNIVNNELYADPCFDEREHFAVGGRDLAYVVADATKLTQYCPSGELYTGTQVAWMTRCYQPDVVLGFMGYNDLKAYDPNASWGKHGYTASQLLANAKVFVQEVEAAKPGTPVGMAKVLSTKVDTVVDGSAYNTALTDAIPSWRTEGLPVGLVDPGKHWLFLPDTWDKYHPNAQGEVHLAWGIAEGLAALDDRIAALDDVPMPTVPLGPRTPGTLSVTGGTASSATLAWTFPVGADREVLYQRDVTAGTDWVKVHDAAYDRGATITGLQRHQYEFRIQAAKGSALAQADDLQPLYSAPVEVDLSTLGEVARVDVTGTYHGVSASWTAAESADRYLVRARRVSPSATGWVSVSTSSTSYAFAKVAAGARYEVTVTPVRKNISGATTPAVSAVARGTVNPALPRPAVTKPAPRRLRMVWAKAPSATRYQVRIRPAGGAWRTLGWTTSTRFTSPRLVKGRTYAVAVVAWDSYVPGRTSPAARFRVR